MARKSAPILKNARHPEAFAGSFMGCSCCNKRQVRRAGKKSAKQAEKRQWRREVGL